MNPTVFTGFPSKGKPIQLPPCKPLTATLYKKGAIITGWPRQPGGGGDRGCCKDASERSLRHFSFLLENSTASWLWMSTLTFRVEHPAAKACLREWFGSMPFCSTWNFSYAWFMELQERGAVHFHVLLGDDCVANSWMASRYTYSTIRRRGKPVDIVLGAAADWIADVWQRVVGDTSDAFASFQAGGITERLRSSDAAGRYAAKHASKKKQKTLSPDQEGLGRWWYISYKALPKPLGTVDLNTWNLPSQFTHVWDKTTLGIAEKEGEPHPEGTSHA